MAISPCPIWRWRGIYWGVFLKEVKVQQRAMSCHLPSLIYSSSNYWYPIFLSPGWVRSHLSLMYFLWIWELILVLPNIFSVRTVNPKLFSRTSYLASFVNFRLLLEHILLCPIGGNVSKVWPFAGPVIFAYLG